MMSTSSVIDSVRLDLAVPLINKLIEDQNINLENLLKDPNSSARQIKMSILKLSAGQQILRYHESL